jgi:rhodanese-related sulfurtransferase
VRMSEIEFNEFQAKQSSKKKGSKRKPCSMSIKSSDILGLSVTKCPHKLALEALAKKPELIKGNYEHYDQVRIFYHFAVNDKVTYESLVSVPNGGQRHAKTAAGLRAEGLKKGYPDMQLDIAKGGYFGLRLELKQEDKKKGRITPEQQTRLELLHDNGYYSVKAWGHDEAIRAIKLYMLLPNTIFKPMVLNNDFNKATG